MLELCQKLTTVSRQLPKANICQRQAKYMPAVILRLEMGDKYSKQRYTKYMRNICQRYARSKFKTATYMWMTKNLIYI